MFAWFNPPLQVSKLLKRKIHIFFFISLPLKKKRERTKFLHKNSTSSIYQLSFQKFPRFLFITNPRGIQNIYILQIIRWQPYETERREKEKKKKKREREKNNSRKSSRAAFRKVGFFTPLHERCILNVAWRKLFQKDRKCAREWTTAPKLNITSQSFVECAAIYSVSLADPVYN